jgi:hypothetical protein
VTTRSSTTTGLLAGGTLAVLACVLGLLAACTQSLDLGTHDAGGLAEAGAPDGPSNGFGITVTTVAPTLTSAPGEKVSATWAAFRLDEGDWRVLAPTATGTYVFAIPTARWAIALVCADEDAALTTVFVHRRTAATHALEVSLEPQCTPEPPPAEFAITGTISNLPPTTQWLDFGYARDTRGVVFPVTGGKGTYEIVGVAPGTWDLGFGIRDDSFTPLTRILLVRGTNVSADRTLDIDATGPASFVPGSKRLVLRGLEASDTVTPQVLYAAGGPHGIDVGPQDVPVDMRDVTLAYATVPDAMQVASDRYHGAITAERDNRETRRSIELSVHQAIDIDVALLPVAAKPLVKVLGTAPQVRLETRFPVLPNAARHEARVLSELNRRTQHVWHASYDAAMVAGSTEVVDTMPDLSMLSGWQSSWALPVGVPALVTATSYEVVQALGDGTVQRASGNSATVMP